MPVVEIYTQPGCPYCVRAVDLLRSKGVEMKEINAPRGTAERQEAIERSGVAQTVPQIFIGDQALGGCTELMGLDRAGKLDNLLGIN